MGGFLNTLPYTLPRDGVGTQSTLFWNVTFDPPSVLSRLVPTFPVCVGFGISTPEHAAAVAKAGADGVIIGSRIVKIIEDNLGNKEKTLSEISAFLKDVKKAIETMD